MDNDMSRRVVAEFFGTFWLVLGGCGAAVLAAKFPETGIGFLGVAFAFGLTVLTMAYAVGHLSGGHFNPAVTIGLWAGGRFKAADVLPYIIAQVVGAIVAAAALIGFCCGIQLISSLALPPLTAAPDDVHHLSAGTFAIGYLVSFLAPPLGGAIWDATGSPATAFIAGAVSTALVVAAALTLPRFRTAPAASARRR